MDEPLSALDALTRANLSSKIEAIWAAEKRTVVLISNDVDEALVLADRILCLNPDGTLGAAFKTLRADVTACLMEVGIKGTRSRGRALCPS
jgi:nitrate/nitrite transport system ATP-binding protein